jgi:cytochrome P450
MGQPMLIASTPEGARILLNSTTAHALWGGIVPASEAFFGKSVLFVLEGDQWKRLRSIMRDSFKMQRLDMLSQDVTECAVRLANRLQEFADNGMPVDMNAALTQYHLASIGKSSFDYDMDVMQKFPKPNDISISFEYLLQELPRRTFHPDEKVREDYLSGTEDNIKWQKAAKTVRKVVMQTIVKRLEEELSRGIGKTRGDLLDSMIAAYRTAEATVNVTKNNQKPTDAARTAELMMDSIGDNLVEIFFAGYGTSVVTMCVALYYLATNKKLMQEAHMEVDDVIPGDVEVGMQLQAQQFPFLSRVFKEALRMVPPAPLMARVTTDEVTVEGIKIPANTKFWIPAIYLHKDPQSWGSTVDIFDPQRFEKPVIAGSFVPFSGGARECIGKHFAELETVVGLAVLLKTYDFDVAPGFQFLPIFTGFGTRVGDASNMNICCNLVPKRRTDISSFIYDWTPGKFPRRNSNPLFSGVAEEDLGVLPKPPKFA